MPHGGIKHINPSPTLGTKFRVRSDYFRYVFTNRKHKINNKKVHQLVAEAFHGPRPSDKHVVMHLDDNSLNNHKDNLKWGTQKENLNTDSFIAYCKSRVGDNSPVRKGMHGKL